MRFSGQILGVIAVGWCASGCDLGNTSAGGRPAASGATAAGGGAARPGENAGGAAVSPFSGEPSPFGDPRACGPSGQICSAGPASFAVCENATCGFRCRPSFADCNLKASDGCEVDLTSDPKNCGACARDCLGSSCEAKACLPIVLATNQDKPNQIAIVGDTIFWTSNGHFDTSAVRRLPTAGAAMATEVSGYPGNTWGIFADDANIYWTGNDGGGKGAWVRDRAGLTSSRYLAGFNDNNRGIAVEGDTVYWAAEGTPDTVDSGGVYSIKVDGTDKKVLAEKVQAPRDVLAKDGVVYYSAANGIYRIPPGGVPSALVKGPLGPAGLHFFDGAFYWVDTKTGEVATVPISGDTPTLLATDASGPTNLAVDASGVYWINNFGEVVALRKGHTLPVTLARGQVELAGIALDATAVYFTSQGDHSVKKVAK